MVGYSGTGTLNISGGSVTSGNAALGYFAGSLGAVSVTNGTWSTSAVQVGYSGTGTLTINDAGRVTVDGSLSRGAYGTINLNAGGTLQIGTGSTTGILVTALVNNGTLILDRSDNWTHSYVISGSGSLVKQGAGALTLTGTNTYSGGTTLSAGALVGTPSSLQGDIAAAAGTRVTFNQATAGTYAGNLTGAGALTNAGAGVLTLTGTNTYSGGTTLSLGALVGTSSSLQGDIAAVANTRVTFNQSTAGTYAGIYSGGGSLMKSGAGELMLTGSNSYSGGTTLSLGALVGTSSSLQGNIATAAGTGVTFDQAATGTYSGNLSGGATLSKLGVGSLTLSGSNSFTGQTTVGAGTLVLGSGKALASTAAVVVNAGATLQATTPIRIGYLDSQGTVSGSNSLTATLTVTRSGNIGGIADGSDGQGSFAAGVVKLGTGTSTVNAANTYTGLTWVREGTLAVGTVNAFAAASSITVDAGATLANTTGGQTITVKDVTVQGSLVASGGLLTSTGVLDGSGTITGDVLTTGEFRGNQTITGNVELQGLHAPGNSAGIQTITGDLSYTSGGSGPSVAWELFSNTVSNSGTTSFDQIMVGGNLTFSTSTPLGLAFNGVGSTVNWNDAFWNTNEQWAVWKVTGTTAGFGSLSLTTANWLDAYGGSFTTARPGATFTLGLSGQDVVLNYVAAVPEPAACASLLAGFAIGSYSMWRRRKRV